MKMISPVYLTALGLVVAYCKTDAQTPAGSGAEARRCYQCSGLGCDARPPPDAACMPERPYCATLASAPNFNSSLTCAASNGLPCSLSYTAKQKLEMICICTTELCNAPFSKDLQFELMNFSTVKIPKNHHNNTDYINTFWKQSHLFIDNDSHIYQKITMKMLETTESAVRNRSEMEGAMRRARAQAEMLQQDEPDDDEDEGEGSGSDEEVPRRAPPAAPSSRLPADGDDSAAHRPMLALLATVPAFFYLLL